MLFARSKPLLDSWRLSRSAATMRKFAAGIWILLMILSMLSTPSESAVSSIDLGSEWMKVAVVDLKPGRSPISIAINEMSKRKSPAVVAFNGGNRLVGEEAAAIVARYPDKVYSFVRDMIGKPYEYVKVLAESLYLPYDLVEDSRGAASIRIDDGVTVYSAEELLAMILGYGISLAESHARVPVKDAVIAVPPFFGQAERRGLIQAAQLAGINVLSLINEHAGAALQYGIDKDFSNDSRYVIFYDMGSSSTYAALVYFSAYNTKEFGRTVSVNQFQVKDVRWDAKLGGQDMELRLVEYFADEFNKQLGSGIDVRKSPKAMAKLKKQVKRTKEILSANTAAPISVESLLDDIDFRSTISREKFEELCSDLWEKALVPVKEVLKHSGLKLNEIYAVELIGGATRVPRLQAKLQEFLGRNDLDKHLDADEAIVLGASLNAANLSDGIKLNRKLGMIDGSSYGFLLELNGPEHLEDNTDALFIPRSKKMPVKLFRSFKHDKDFEASLSYDKAGELPPGVSSYKFAEYSILGLSEASEKYSTHNISSPIKANLHFSLSRSGILSLDRADAAIEISEWVEVPKKNPTTDNSTGSFNASSETSTGTISQDSAETLKAAEDNDISSNSTESEKEAIIVTEKILKKKTFRIPLKVVEKNLGPGSNLPKDSFLEAKVRLETLDKKDAERRRTAELKNSLEEYIYSTREKIEDNVEVEKVSSEEERRSFADKLSEVQEWLYTDGEDASANEFKERLELLKAIGDPIFFRLNELNARPIACEDARVHLNGLQKIINNWETNKPWIPKDRIEEVWSEAEKLKNWLEEKEELQKKTSVLVAPIFTSEEVNRKVYKLQDKIASVNRIPKPKPKIEKPTKEETVSQDNNTSTSGATSDEPPSETEQSNDSVDASNSETVQENGHDEL
ncbi:heat shock 70 kDa protein 17-like [Curcuma longa]|uniref:heat shock 70 kDa protein 17-like n=1 Tax=Curcuma longa TaxID=136217 RepID=UPI003D9DBDEE